MNQKQYKKVYILKKKIKPILKLVTRKTKRLKNIKEKHISTKKETFQNKRVLFLLSIKMSEKKLRVNKKD